jgi:hypothetical protein
MDTAGRQIEDNARVEIADWLQVRPLDRDRREDAEIRGAALQRLEWDNETYSP